MNWAFKEIESIPDMTPKAAHVLVALAWFHNQETGRCDPSIARIVERTHLSTRSVRNAIRELEKSRVIQTVHRKSRTGNGVLNMNNRYKFHRLGGTAPVADGVRHQLPTKGNLGGAPLSPSAFDDLAMLLDDSERADFQYNPISENSKGGTGQ